MAKITKSEAFETNICQRCYRFGSTSTTQRCYPRHSMLYCLKAESFLKKDRAVRGYAKAFNIKPKQLALF